PTKTFTRQTSSSVSAACSRASTRGRGAGISWRAENRNAGQARDRSRPTLPAMTGTTKPETRSFYANIVQRVIDRITSDLGAALDLETVAASANLSPFHFHRVFRGMVGETALELTRRLRMERAAWSLVHTERAVTQIAFDAGYETHEAFTRAFRA